MNRQQARQDAISRARILLDKQPLYLDTETTGIRSTAEIIEVCVLDHDGSVLMDTLVKPRSAITLEAQRIHGIDDDLVAKAEVWPSIWPRLESIMQGRTIGIFNADFDLRLMKQSHQAAGLTWRVPESELFCIMHLYAQFYGEWDRHRRSYRWQSLEKARRHCRLQLPNSHRARADTMLTRAVLHYIANCHG